MAALANDTPIAPPATRETRDAIAISLDCPGGDVWAWETPVSGACPGCPPEAMIVIRVNGKAIPVHRDGETFRAVAKLTPGANEVAAAAALPDGREVCSAPVRYAVPLAPRPTARLTARIAGGLVVFDSTGSTPSEFDGAYPRTRMLALPERNPAPLDLADSDAGIWSAPVPTVDGDYFASLTIEDERGRHDTTTVRVIVEDGRARVPDPVHEHASWIDRAVVYGVAPRNFDPPGFSGAATRMDDLADLGISALWLSPSTRTNPDSFGYDVTDYFALRPDYGTMADFRELVAAAHQRGMRVLMDFVPNHTSDQHPYFQDAATHGEASHHWDFYDRDAAGAPTHYFNWVHLPNLNFANPEVQRFMLEALSYWVREFDIDGFRLDAIWGIRERQPAWLATLLAEMHRIKPDILLIAEASARDPFYAEQGFGAAYDWTGKLGHWAWETIFGGDVPIGQAMIDALTDSGRGYHEDARVMRFLNNNDTGPRFITTHGVDGYRLALAMLLTLPGLPCLYTGDEAGAEFQPYDTSGPIDWTDRHGLRPFTKRLIHLRQRTPALHSRQWQPLTVAPAEPFFAYLRTAGNESPVIVVLNVSQRPSEAVIALPEGGGGFRGDALVDLWSGETVAAHTRDWVRVSVPGWGFRIMTHAG